MTEFILGMACVALAALLAAGVNRGLIVAAILLPSTALLGLIDPLDLAIAGVFDMHALVMLIAVAMLVVSFGQSARPPLSGGGFTAPFLLLAALWLYGVAAPIARGGSTVAHALDAGKEFMMIFCYFATFAFLRTHREVQTAWRVLLAFGAAYCVIELAAQVLGTRLLERMQLAYRPDVFGLWKVYLWFWPLLLIFLLFSVASYVVERRLPLLSIVLGALGLLLTFYRSYLLATIVTVPALLLIVKVDTTRALRAVMLAGVGLIAVMVAASAYLQTTGSSSVADAFVSSAIRELRDGSGGALAGRQAHSEQLLRLSEARPLLGYGFVDQESALARSLALESFAGSVLGFVDNGWADIRIKFGIVGGALLCFAFVSIAWRAAKTVASTADRRVAAMALTLAMLVPIFFCVLPVHAPLTYSFALLPFAIAAAIVDKARALAAETVAMSIDSSASVAAVRGPVRPANLCH